LEKVLNSA